MQLEATGKPIKYRLKTGEEITLRPGIPMELPDQAATQLLKKAPDKVRRVDQRLAIQSGALITWQRADQTIRRGAVDFLYTDPDGTVWAFVTTPDGWSAINLRYVTET